MSYCRFENTLPDLADCEEHLDDVLSESEQTARDEMLTIIRRIAADYPDAEIARLRAERDEARAQRDALIEGIRRVYPDIDLGTLLA